MHPKTPSIDRIRQYWRTYSWGSVTETMPLKAANTATTRAHTTQTDPQPVNPQTNARPVLIAPHFNTQLDSALRDEHNFFSLVYLANYDCIQIQIILIFQSNYIFKWIFVFQLNTSFPNLMEKLFPNFGLNLQSILTL